MKTKYHKAYGNETHADSTPSTAAHLSKEPLWEELYQEALEYAIQQGHSAFYATAQAHATAHRVMREHHNLLQKLIDLHLAGKTNAKQEAYLEKEILEGNIVA